MQHGSHPLADTEAAHKNCAFCQINAIAGKVFKETPNFRIVADYAPLVEGHLLIMPKRHYACYGAVSLELDLELHTLKDEMKRFFLEFYDQAVFWEHGVFHQTVFHAHLHCFPFGELSNAKYELCEKYKAMDVCSQDALRNWYRTRGQYFYLEANGGAYLFPAEMDTYHRIIRDVLWPGAAVRSTRGWRSPLQRREEGEPVIAAAARNWRLFQQQEQAS